VSSIRRQNLRYLYEKLKREYLKALGKVEAVGDTVDIHCFIRIMHSLGFIHLRTSSGGQPTHSETEEQELTEMWRSLGTKEVSFQSLFTAIAGILNIQLPEMLGSVEERLDA